MTLSKSTIIYSLFIIISASFMRQVTDIFIKLFGGTVFNVAIWTLFLAVGFVCYSVVRTLIKNKRYINIIFVSIVLITSMIYALTFKFPIERVHLILFGTLGFLVLKDNHDNKKLRIPLTIVYCFLVVCIDEIFQYYLPYRFGDPRDLIFGTVGSIFGIALYLGLKYKNLFNADNCDI